MRDIIHHIIILIGRFHVIDELCSLLFTQWLCSCESLYLCNSASALYIYIFFFLYQNLGLRETQFEYYERKGRKVAAPRLSHTQSHHFRPEQALVNVYARVILLRSAISFFTPVPVGQARRLNKK